MPCFNVRNLFFQLYAEVNEVFLAGGLERSQFRQNGKELLRFIFDASALIAELVTAVFCGRNSVVFFSPDRDVEVRHPLGQLRRFFLHGFEACLGIVEFPLVRTQIRPGEAEPLGVGVYGDGIQIHRVVTNRFRELRVFICAVSDGAELVYLVAGCHHRCMRRL